jgi:predicted outer membrane repeat protein
MEGNASITGNTGGGGVLVEGGTFAMQGNTVVSGNTATFYGGGVSVEGGTLTKTGGTIYGEDADTNQKNTVVSGIGNAVYESKDNGWRNVTTGPTMNPGSYGFWLNDGDVVTFPSGFAGTYKRSNFDNTLTLTLNTVKASNSDRMWVLQRVSGNAYTLKRADAANTITLTISLTSSNLVITGDSGSGQDNWNGTWNRQR